MPTTILPSTPNPLPFMILPARNPASAPISSIQMRPMPTNMWIPPWYRVASRFRSLVQQARILARDHVGERLHAGNSARWRRLEQGRDGRRQDRTHRAGGGRALAVEHHDDARAVAIDRHGQQTDHVLAVAAVRARDVILLAAVREHRADHL